MSGIRTMILVFVAALAAVCCADKLDKAYLPPVSAKSAGGDATSLQAPFTRTLEQGSQGLPLGGYTNDYQGVIVDAVNPGTRASGIEQTGLGGPRSTYGSTNSKVGEAAFNEPGSVNSDEVASFRIAPGFEAFVTPEDGKTGESNFRIAPGFGDSFTAEGDVVTKDKISNGLKYSGDGSGFASNNAVAVGEAGGKTQGEYGYKADNGKVHKVTYEGYKQGLNVPTSSFAPEDKNINAAGVVDNGSYDTQKYNSGGYYSDSNNGNKYNDRQPSIEDKGGASGLFVTQNGQPSSNALVASVIQGSNYNSQGSKSGSQFGTPVSSTNGFGEAGQEKKTQFGYKPQYGASTAGQAGFNSQVKTENRFGVQSGSPTFDSQFSFNKGIKTQGSFGNVNYGNPGFNSAFSSAQATGHGVATAFAQTGGESVNQDLKKQSYSNFEGSNLASNPSNPSLAIASASVNNSPYNYDTSYQQYNGSPQTQASANVEAGQVSSYASAQNVPQHFSGTSFGQSSGYGVKNEYLTPLNKTPTVGKPQEVSSAYPTSATATASINPQSDNFGGQSQQQFGSFHSQSGRPGQFGSESGFSFQSQTAKAKPGQYSQGSGSYNQFTSGVNSPSTSLVVKPTQTSSGFSTFNQKPTKIPDTKLDTPFGPTEQPLSPLSSQEFNKFESDQQSSQFSTSSSYGSTPKPQASQFGSSSFQTTYSQENSGQYNSNSNGGSQVNPTNAPFASATQKPFYNKEQGKDDSYTYNRPNKPFITPAKSQGSKYSNSPASISPTPTIGTQTGQYQETPSSYYNGVTQAAASGFSSSSPTPTTLFGTLSGASKPSVSQSSTGIQQSILNRKPFVQSQSKPTSSFSQSSADVNTQTVDTQEYQGTIYEYNKPAEVFPTPSPEQDKSGQVPTGSQSSLGSTQFGTQSSKPITSTSTFQKPSQTTFGSQTTSQFVQKPSLTTFEQKPFGSVQTGGSYQQNQIAQKPQSTVASLGQNQYGQKPFGSSLFTSSLQNKFSSSQPSTLFGQKPTANVPGFGSISSSQGQNAQTTLISSKPFGSQGSNFQQNQGSSTDTQFISKPQTTQTSSFTSNKYQSQSTQLNSKPIDSSQVGGSSFQQSQIGTTGTQFGLKPQKTTSAVSQSQISQSNGRPVDSTSTVSIDNQQTQFGSTTGLQLSQTPSTGSQSTVFTVGQKPFGSSQSTGSYQQNQYGPSTGYQSGQKPQITQGFTSTSSSKGQAVQTQFVQKPFSNFQASGTNFQQSQFGSTGSTFGQKPSSQGSGFNIGTGSSQLGYKPFASTTSSKDQTIQTTQLGQKPFGNSQPFGNSFQQTQFSSSASTFGQKPSTQGSIFSIGTDSSQSKQKPSGGKLSGTNFQQGQFGSTTGSQYGQKPNSGFQDSKYVSSTGTQFGLTPTSGSQAVGSKFQQNQAAFIGSQQQKPQFAYQQNQYGTSGSTYNFNQKPQNGFSIGMQSTQGTQKPFGSAQTGSIFQQNQYDASYSTTFGQKPQKTQGSSFSISNVAAQSDSKPSTSQTSGLQQTQYGSSIGSQFGQKPLGSIQSTFGQKPFGSSPTGTTNQQIPFSAPTASQFDKKPEVTQEPLTNTAAKEQVVQTSQFGETIIDSTASSFQKNPLDSISSQFAQKPSTTSSQIQSSQFGQKPFGNSQTTSSLQQSQFGSTGSQYGKIPSQGSFFTSQFPITSSKPQFGIQSQKPFGNVQTTQKPGFQQTQFGSSLFSKKPIQNTGSVFGTQPSQYSQTQFGSQNQKPFGYQTAFPQNQFGSVTGQYGQNPQTSSVSTSTTGTKFGSQLFGSSQSSSGSKFSIGALAQKPFGSTQTQQSEFTQTPSKFSQSQTNQGNQSFGDQTQKPFGGNLLSQTSLGAANESQKPFGSTGSGIKTQFAQSFDQKTQQTLSTNQAASAESSVQTGSFDSSGYIYQKPFSTFGSQFGTQTSRPLVDQKLQPSQASAFASTSQPDFSSQTFKPFETQGSKFPTTLNPIQYGVQSTEAPEFGYTLQPQYTGVPISSANAQVTSFQPTPSSIPQTFKPFGAAAQGSSYGQSQSTFGTSEFGIASLPSAQGNVQSSQGSKFSQVYGTQIPTFQTTLGPLSSVTTESSVGNTQIAESLAAVGEKFGGPREPPKFDEKTGYHY